MCNKRCDSLGDEVRVRIEGTPSDLHAAEARYLIYFQYLINNTDFFYFEKVKSFIFIVILSSKLGDWGFPNFVRRVG